MGQYPECFFFIEACCEEASHDIVEALAVADGGVAKTRSYQDIAHGVDVFFDLVWVASAAEGAPHIFLDLGGDGARIHDVAMLERIVIARVRMQAIPRTTALEPEVLVVAGLRNNAQASLVHQEFANAVLVSPAEDGFVAREHDSLEIVLVLGPDKIARFLCCTAGGFSWGRFVV